MGSRTDLDRSAGNLTTVVQSFLVPICVTYVISDPQSLHALVVVSQCRSVMSQNFVMRRGRDSSVVQRWATGLLRGVSSLGRGNFSLHQSVQTGSGAHPTSYPMGNRGSFSGGKAAEA
jgi:hypothetical protein